MNAEFLKMTSKIIFEIGVSRNVKRLSCSVMDSEMSKFQIFHGTAKSWKLANIETKTQ